MDAHAPSVREESGDESWERSFVFEGESFKYSADEEEYWVYLRYVRVGNAWSLAMKREVDRSSTYTAMNNRGVITTVDSFLLTTYMLAFPDFRQPPRKDEPFAPVMSRIGFRVPVGKAAAISEHGQVVRMVLSGRTAGRPIAQDDAKKATLSSPTEYLNRQKALPFEPTRVTLRVAETNEILATLDGSVVLEPKADTH